MNALDPDADQEILDHFCASHRLVSIDKQFVERNDFCYWSVCVTYLNTSSAPSKPAQASNKRAQVDYRETLNDTDFEVFAKLRNLRKVLADTDGVPIYAVFTNAQLADMVTQRATTLTALGEINGIGTAKLDKYGKHFINVLQTTLASLDTPPADETPLHHAG